MSSHHSSARRRVEEALAGRLPLADLGSEERLVANAEIDAAIAERARAVNVGTVLGAEGITTVALDDDGRRVRYAPDGTTTVID